LNVYVQYSTVLHARDILFDFKCDAVQLQCEHNGGLFNTALILLHSK